jgi:predicted acetyltransferase
VRVVVGRGPDRRPRLDPLRSQRVLAEAGGHIGYAVLPAHRRQGFATEILRQSLVIARSEGVDDVLVTCDVDNVGSRLVIERCGGEFESIVYDGEERIDKRRFWIR